MSINIDIALAPCSLLFGFVLMTFPGPRPDASEPEPADSKGVLMITDFTANSPDLDWYVQNDNVMGGRSEGGFETEKKGELIFAGSTNTNGGGFSSIRTQPVQLDLSKYDGIQLRVMGDGRRYTWELQTTARYRNFKVSYWADFNTLKGEWSTVKIPFASFYPQFRGFKLDGPELDTSEIREFGLYIYDKLDGPFELRLASVQAYTEKVP